MKIYKLNIIGDRGLNKKTTKAYKAGHDDGIKKNRRMLEKAIAENAQLTATLVKAQRSLATISAAIKKKAVKK